MYIFFFLCSNVNWSQILILPRQLGFCVWGYGMVLFSFAVCIIWVNGLQSLEKLFNFDQFCTRESSNGRFEFPRGWSSCQRKHETSVPRGRRTQKSTISLELFLLSYLFIYILSTSYNIYGSHCFPGPPTLFNNILVIHQSFCSFLLWNKVPKPETTLGKPNQTKRLQAKMQFSFCCPTTPKLFVISEMCVSNPKLVH